MFENYILKDLWTQPSHIQVTCSAYSAFNWLKLIGAPIDLKTGERLINKVLTTKTPIEESDLQELALKYGYKMKTHFPNEKHVYVDDMTGEIVSILEQSPILQNISTHFSKKNRSIAPSINASHMKDSKGKLITHAVVIIKEPPSQILIFDPYKPFRPEIFDISDKQERLTFLSWVFRSYYQYRLGDKSGKNVILSLAQQELSQPEVVEKNQINMFGFLQAKIRYLVPNI